MAVKAEEVQYVRLPERLVSGNVTDLESGWGISGLDVKAVPDQEDEPEAWQFVIDKIRAGIIEEASAEEHDMVRSIHRAVEAVAKNSLPTEFGGPAKPSPWNEAAIENVAKKHRRKLMAARVANVFASEPEPATEESQNYNKMHKSQLQQLCRDRDLDDGGSKEDLITRLEDDDTKP